MRTKPFRIALLITAEESLSAVLNLLNDYLKPGSAEVFSTKESLEKYLRHAHPSLIIADYGHPDFPPPSLIDWWQAKFPTLPLILFSTTMEIETAAWCIKSGVSDVLNPNHPQRFIQRVVEFLEINRGVPLFWNNPHGEPSLGFYHKIAGAMLDVIFTLSPKGEILYLNTVFEKMTGWKISEWLGRPFDLLIHEEDRERARELFKKTFSGEYHPGFTLRINCKDRSAIFAEFSASFLKSEGKIIRIIGVARNATRRVLAEAELQESKKSLEILMSNLPGMVYRSRMDQPENIEFVSRGCFQLTGYRPEELLRNPKNQFRSLIHPKDRAVVQDTIRQARGNGRPFQLTYRLKNADGRYCWVWEKGQQIPVSDTDRPYYEGIVLDVDEHQRTRIALEENEKLFRSIVEFSHDGITIVDDQARFVYANEEFYSMVGYPPEEIIGRRFHFLLEDGDRSKVVSNFRRRQRGESVPNRYDFSIKRKDGKIREVEISSTTIKMPDGRVRTVSQLLDITDRKNAIKALKESEAKFRSLVENSTDAIYVIQDERFIFINPKFEELFEYKIEEISQPGFHFTKLVAPTSMPIIDARLKLYKEGKKIPAQYIFTAVSKSGKERDFEVSVNQIVWEGRPAILGTLRDVTDRIHLEEQLRQAQKMEAVGRLAGGIAHDFNNLLTIIRGYSDLLLPELENNSKIHKRVEQISRAGEKAATLTNQLLAFSRKQVVQPRIINLNDLVLDLQEMIYRVIGEHIRLDFRLTEAPAYLEADPGQLDQVLINLFVNARDAMPQGGAIVVETDTTVVETCENYKNGSQRPGHYILLKMTDTGVGMDEETLSHIFEPFFTTKGKGQGTGLGLSTVYGIIEQCGGWIDCQSEPGKGTTFVLYFPRKEAPSNLGIDAPGFSQGNLSNKTILVVEDDENVRGFITTILESENARILEACDGLEALKIYEQNGENIHLVLSDIVMPRMSGKELIDELHRRNHQPKFLLMSGYTDNALVDQGKLDPDFPLLLKPFTRQKLVTKIQQFLVETACEPKVLH